MHNVLRYATFDQITVRQDASGCGIMPVSVRPSDGKICFLLAREHHVPSWKAGSMRWSAFEGGRHAGESIEQAAVREWREESMSVIHDITEDDLHQRRYVCKLTLKVLQTRRALAMHGSRFHVTYAVEVPYDAHHEERFHGTRAFALKSHFAAARLNAVIAQVLGESRAGRLVRAVRLPHNRIEVVFEDGETDLVESGEWIAAASTFPSSTSHVGITLHVASVEGAIPHRAGINVDFLEKETVRWWTVDELGEVLANGGRLHDEQFRVYFLPVLEGMYDFFTRTANIRRDRRVMTRSRARIVEHWDGSEIISRV